jgi:hypothetical protein
MEEKEENYLFFDGEKRTEAEIKDLAGAYQYIFNCAQGAKVLEDLRLMSRVDEPFGCALSHEEFSYRAGLQDMFKYIEALSSIIKE